MAGEKAVVDLRQGFGSRSAAAMSNTSSKCWSDFEPLHDRFGMLARAVGEDELAAGEAPDRSAERGIGHERRVVDVVNEFEEIIGLQAVLGHQTAQGGAVAPVIILLHAVGSRARTRGMRDESRMRSSTCCQRLR